MLKKAVLHYFDGRGRAEIIRLTMAAANIEVCDYILNKTKLK
jgi:hypothetical protein